MTLVVESSPLMLPPSFLTSTEVCAGILGNLRTGCEPLLALLFLGLADLPFFAISYLA